MAKTVDVKIESKKLTARLSSVKKGALQACSRAVYQGMQVAFLNSQKEVPVLTGTLKNSGQLKEPVEVSATKSSVSITYGGLATKYAQRQHDDMTLNHPHGGKAHFVIDPVRDAIPDIKKRMKAELAKLGKE